MEKAELKQALQRALLQGMEAEDNALEGIRERLRSMGVDQMHSLLRQLFILQQAGVEPSLGLHSSSGGSERKEEKERPTSNTSRQGRRGEFAEKGKEKVRASAFFYSSSSALLWAIKDGIGG